MPSIITFSLLLILLLAACTGREQGPAPEAPAAEAVAAIRIAHESYRPSDRYLARVQASKTAAIRPQVSGIVTAQHFQEGSSVAQGQPLYEVDRRAYEAAVQLSKARVAQADAALQIAALRTERTCTLRASGTVSPQALDEVEAELRQARAQHSLTLAMLEQAEIDLRHCVIRSPIDGVIGRSDVTVGALVSTNQLEVLAEVQQLNPVWVDIERPLADQLRMDASGAQVSLVLEDGTEVRESGKVRLVESRVNRSSNTLLTRAEFANADAKLLPGMRAEAVLTSASEIEAIFIPQHSMRRLPDGKGQVMLVNDQSRIELRTVELGDVVEGRWRVNSGLAPGEIIVAAGLQKLKPEMLVQAKLPETPALAQK